MRGIALTLLEQRQADMISRLFEKFAIRAICVAGIAAALVLGQGSQPRAQERFDGTWSVLIVTESGECDRAYRYGIRIKGGQILYDGEAGVSFTGRVEGNGQITATVGRGEQRATGNGRLSGTSGTGTWRGQSGTGACAGRWEAERR